jgi:hypothetical protein
MNKLKTLIGALLIFTSCSENVTQEPIEKPIDKPIEEPIKENRLLLLKTIEEINPSSGLATTFTYEGFKIKDASTMRINAGQYKINYTYTGDLITQEDGYANDILYFRTEYTYENNKLKTAIFKSTNSGTIFPPMNDTKLVYDYISENIVDINSYSYSNNNWQQSQFTTKVKIYFSNGNIIKRERINSVGNITATVDYEYDDNPNIYKNITGFDKLFFTNSFTNNFNRHFNIQDISNANNVIFFKETINGFVAEAERYKYAPNLDGYPNEKHHYWSSNQYLIEKKYAYY